MRVSPCANKISSIDRLQRRVVFHAEPAVIQCLSRTDRRVISTKSWEHPNNAYFISIMLIISGELFFTYNLGTIAFLSSDHKFSIDEE
jgi:hypothetical protein